jgi:hypothetical protein
VRVRIDGVDLRESSIHGTGVFATRGFDPGEMILAIDDSRIVDEAHPLDESRGEFEHHCDLLGDREILMRVPERYINHSCEPSTYVARVDGVRRVVAYRRIEPGDEGTYDYLVDAYGGNVWQCSCGEATCRGTHVHDFFSSRTRSCGSTCPCSTRGSSRGDTPKCRRCARACERDLAAEDHRR